MDSTERVALPLATDGTTAREIAHRCARAAGDIFRAAGGPQATISKGTTSGGRNDPVTSADPAIERVVTEILLAAYPGHAVLGEETGDHAGEADWQWIIDPIDGTRNFSSGIPWTAFNLALYGQGIPRLALTHDPYHHETFYAESGAGTTVNGVAVQVRDVPRLRDAFVGIDIGLEDTRGRALLAALHDLFPGVQAVRIPGTVALGLAYVAAGRFDAYLHPSPYLWDFAPGELLVREAGGVATEVDGVPLTPMSRSIVASGLSLHEELVERFRRVVEVAAKR
jgi:fructose-1,6-bisphosphatase/inositol monophosphatase family enzyme